MLRRFSLQSLLGCASLLALSASNVVAYDANTLKAYNSLAIKSTDDLRFAADVNGDGFDDLVSFDPYGVEVRLAEPKGDNGLVFSGSQRVLRTAFGEGWKKQSHVRLVTDVNGDGRADIVGFGNNDVFVSLSESTGSQAKFSPPKVCYSRDFASRKGRYTTDRHPRFVADVNNDGLGDIVAFGADGVYVALGENNLFEGFRFKEKVRVMSDFGANGPWAQSQNYIRTVADIDDDGRADIVGFGKNGVYVAFSDASLFEPTKFLPAKSVCADFCLDWGWTSEHKRTLADVNGDGRLDLVGFGNDGVRVALQHAGRGFRSSSRWVNDFGKRQGWTNAHTRILHDMNGDGSADLVGIKDSTLYVGLSAGLANTSDFDFFTKPSTWLIGEFADNNPNVVVGTFNHRDFAHLGGVVQFDNKGHTLGKDLTHFGDYGFFKFLEWRIVEKRIDNFQRHGRIGDADGNSLEDLLDAFGWFDKGAASPDQLTVALGYGAEASFFSFANLTKGVFSSYDRASDSVIRGTYVAEVKFLESVNFSVGAEMFRSYSESWGGVDKFEGREESIGTGYEIGTPKYFPAPAASLSLTMGSQGPTGWESSFSLGFGVGLPLPSYQITETSTNYELKDLMQ